MTDTMMAAIVSDFAAPPSYGSWARPLAGEGEEMITVRATAASQLVRAIATGTHYSSPKELPFIPGVDGVGRLQDGRRVYFAFPRTPFGSMAEQTVVPARFCVEIPDDLDDALAAAIANPGMSSWAALTERAHLKTGETVLVNGATGVSGRLAVKIARYLGAGRVIATGRDEQVLASLGADAVVPLRQSPEALKAAFKTELKSGVDIVLDYLWGLSAELLIGAASGHGSRDAEPRLRFVQIGSMSGANISLPGGALRSSGLELLGSGIGSVSMERLVGAIGDLMKAVVPGGLAVDYRSVPLHEIATQWSDAGDKRLVFLA